MFDTRTFTAAPALALATALIAAAPECRALSIEVTGSQNITTNIDVVVPVNKSEIVQINEPFKELYVGNSDIADVLVLSDHSVYVLGKKVGSTSLTIYGPNKQVVGVLDLSVAFDLHGLKRKLFEVLPNEPIEVRPVNGGVLLSGTVSSPSRLESAVAIAERYAPQSVTNNLAVLGSQQVMLQVRFVEIARTLARQLGINWAVAVGDAAKVFTFGAISAAPFAQILGHVVTGDVSVDALLNAMERKGLVKTLAEPNLVALSGDTASFLAGGEFPIPVAQDNNRTTIEFKQFGVGLAFTPTVTNGDLINLVVTPEVSQPDRTNAVRVAGLEIPALTTRRATTTVELRDGQSFAMAGLIQSNFTDSIRQMPWLGDVPVLGSLLRSTEFERRETELVIMVTPRLVAPARSPAALMTPADTFMPPSDLGLFLVGRIEATKALAPAATAAPMPVLAEGQGGLSGPYGHIVH